MGATPTTGARTPPAVTPVVTPAVPPPVDDTLSDLERYGGELVERGHASQQPYLSAEAYADDPYASEEVYTHQPGVDARAITPVSQPSVAARASISIPSAAIARGSDMGEDFRAQDNEWPPRREVLAASLDSLAQRIRTGELPVPGFETGMEDAAALAAVLAAVLGVKK
jgi:hypothetical protein